MTLEEVKKNIDSLVIPEKYTVILEDIKKTEGGFFHKNNTELDITSGHGIYRNVNDKELIWDYVDELLSDKKMKSFSEKLDFLNSTINKKIENYLAYLFYKKYYSKIFIEEMDTVLVPIMTNLFTLSQKGAVLSIQRGLVALETIKLFKYSQTITIDGDFGKITLGAIREINKDTNAKWLNRVLATLVVNYMKSYLIDVSLNKKEKLIYLNGWDNRMNDLLNK